MRSEKIGHGDDNRLLTNEEEQVLTNWIVGSYKRAMPVNKIMVLQALNDIILKDEQLMYQRNVRGQYDNHNHWYQNYLKRHTEISIRTPEPLTTARRNLSEAKIRQWFSDTQTYLSENDLMDILKDFTRLFNIDEMGIELSPKYGKVLGLRGDKYCFQEVSKHDKQRLTVLSVVGGDGAIPPPLIIYPQKRINVQMADQFPGDFVFSVGHSNSGYITFKTLYEFLVKMTSMPG